MRLSATRCDVAALLVVYQPCMLEEPLKSVAWDTEVDGLDSWDEPRFAQKLHTWRAKFCLRSLTDQAVLQKPGVPRPSLFAIIPFQVVAERPPAAVCGPMSWSSTARLQQARETDSASAPVVGTTT